MTVHLYACPAIGSPSPLSCSDYGPEAAAAAMGRLAKLAARHLGNQGFSIGIDDVTPRQQLSLSKADILARGYRETEEYIAAYKKGELQLQVWVVVPRG